jgi:hypothetical protein
VSKYPWEIESYDPVAGSMVAWVKLPSINASTGVTFYMCYGDAGVGTQQNAGSFSVTNAWDANHRCVLHIPNGAAPVFKDSTSPTNDATPTSIVAATGKVGGCMATSGTPSRVQLGATLPVSAFPFTIELWAKIASLPLGEGTFGLLCGLFNGINSEHFSLYWSRPGAPTDTQVRIFGVSGDGANLRLIGKSIVADLNWHYLVGVWTNASTYAIYYDGVVQTPLTIDITQGTGLASPTALNIATLGQNAVSGTFANQFNGALDEVRISNSARGAVWILANYNAQNAPGTVGAPGFLVYGSEVFTGVVGPVPLPAGLAVPPYQSLNLAANTPTQLVNTVSGFNLTILNTGPGNLYVGSTSAVGPNAASMLIPALQSAPMIVPARSAVWLLADQAGGVSVAAVPR